MTSRNFENHQAQDSFSTRIQKLAKQEYGFLEDQNIRFENAKTQNSKFTSKSFRRSGMNQSFNAANRTNEQFQEQDKRNQQKLLIVENSQESIGEIISSEDSSTTSLQQSDQTQSADKNHGQLSNSPAKVMMRNYKSQPKQIKSQIKNNNNNSGQSELPQDVYQNNRYLQGEHHIYRKRDKNVLVNSLISAKEQQKRKQTQNLREHLKETSKDTSLQTRRRQNFIRLNETIGQFIQINCISPEVASNQTQLLQKFERQLKTKESKNRQQITRRRTRQSNLLLFDKLPPKDKITIVQEVYKNSQEIHHTIDRENLELRQLFNSLQDEGGKKQIAHQADKIILAFEIPSMVCYEDYCLLIERFLRKKFIEKLKLAFALYDHNNDNKICINDTFQSMRALGSFDYLIQNDIIQISKQLNRKADEFRAKLTYCQNERYSQILKGKVKAIEQKYEQQNNQQFLQQKQNLNRQRFNSFVKTSSRNKTSFMLKDDLYWKKRLSQYPVADLRPLNPEASSSNITAAGQDEKQTEQILKFKLQLHDMQQGYQKFQSSTVNNLGESHSSKINEVLDRLRKFNMAPQNDSYRSFLEYCAVNFNYEDPEIDSILTKNQRNRPDEEQKQQKKDQLLKQQAKTQVFDIKQAFQSYMENKRYNQNQDYLDFLDFCKIGFDNHYPEIIADLVFYMARLDIQKFKGDRSESYHGALISQVEGKPYVTGRKGSIMTFGNSNGFDVMGRSIPNWRYSQSALEETIRYIGNHPLHDEDQTKSPILSQQKLQHQPISKQRSTYKSNRDMMYRSQGTNELKVNLIE